MRVTVAGLFNGEYWFRDLTFHGRKIRGCVEVGLRLFKTYVIYFADSFWVYYEV